MDDLVAVATAADRLGYHHLTASEHIAIPHRGERTVYFGISPILPHGQTPGDLHGRGLSEQTLDP